MLIDGDARIIVRMNFSTYITSLKIYSRTSEQDDSSWEGVWNKWGEKERSEIKFVKTEAQVFQKMK